MATTRVPITGWRRWNSNRQAQTVAEINEYTPLVIDLIDDLNQGGFVDLDSNGVNDLGGGQPVDWVSGYTLAHIQ